MGKRVIKGSIARQALLSGVKALASAVVPTMGPKGRNTAYMQNFVPFIVNDGTTILNHLDDIEVSDSEETNYIARLAGQTVIGASAKTAEVAGDNTSLTCLLLSKLYEEAVKLVEVGYSPTDIRTGINLACGEAIKVIKNMAAPVKDNDDIKHIATISSQSEFVGDIIAKAFETVGNDGLITLSNSKSTKTELRIVKGCQHSNTGYLSQHFVNNKEKNIVEYENCRVLCVDKVLDNMQEIVRVLELISKEQQPLLLIAHDISHDLLATLVVNNLRGMLKIVGVKAPSYGEYRTDFNTDIAVLTGGRCVNDATGIKLSDIKEIDDIGIADKVIVTKDSFTIIKTGKTPLLEEHIEMLKTKVKQNPESSHLKERLAKVGGSVAEICVGGVSVSEQKELFLRCEDALAAAKSVISTNKDDEISGIVPGGGVTLLQTADILEHSNYSGNKNVMAGFNVVIDIMKEHIKVICNNAGFDGSVIANKIASKEETFFNAATGRYEELNETVVVDSAKAICSALTNACSAVALLITTEAVIVEVSDKNKSINNMSLEPKMMMV